MTNMRLIRYRDGSLHYLKDGKQVELPTIPTYYYRKHNWWRCRFYVLNILLKPFKRIYSKFLSSEKEKCKTDCWYWYAICVKSERRKRNDKRTN